MAVFANHHSTNYHILTDGLASQTQVISSKLALFILIPAQSAASREGTQRKHANTYKQQT